MKSRRRKSCNFTFRITDDLKRMLKRAARKSGRSMSEEATHRLDRSFPSPLDGLPTLIGMIDRQRQK